MPPASCALPQVCGSRVAAQARDDAADHEVGPAEPGVVHVRRPCSARSGPWDRPWARRLPAASAAVATERRRRRHPDPRRSSSETRDGRAIGRCPCMTCSSRLRTMRDGSACSDARTSDRACNGGLSLSVQARTALLALAASFLCRSQAAARRARGGGHDGLGEFRTGRTVALFSRSPACTPGSAG